MTAILNSIAFDEDTKQALLKISASNGNEEYEGTQRTIDFLYDLGNEAQLLSGLPAGEYTMVIKADLTVCQKADLYLYNIAENIIYPLPSTNLEKIVQSMLAYSESYIELEMAYENSAQDDAAQEKYEEDSCALSALRTGDLKAALSAHITTEQPRFFHELLQGLQLLVQDYAQNLLEFTAQGKSLHNDFGGDAPATRMLQ